ncbi:hypothetical protein [Frigoriglobus tundricola]|uniref:Uncharacterized protein n=1 Tax=Frigoriglobus tundricola TaxID=2774151 RepID=A0A6M5YHV8_9BACT|nr:hypothetical protein [Frigoriglobus tundricola]QJW93659.1 hypothetical protein FTUN_1167 [Frigoriglobus tundricola]
MGLGDWFRGPFDGRRDAPPSRLVVRDSAYALDGGTIHLRATDERGRELGIVLVQHAFPDAGRSMDAIPGRLYFGSQLVPVRSELEERVLRLLADAEVQAPPPPPPQPPRKNFAVIGDDIQVFLSRTPENCRAFLRETVEFVRAERYVAFAAEVERAAAAE